MDNWTRWIMYLILAFIALIIYLEMYSGSKLKDHHHNYLTYDILGLHHNISKYHSWYDLNVESSRKSFNNSFLYNVQNRVPEKDVLSLSLVNTKTKNISKYGNMHFYNGNIISNVVKNTSYKNVSVAGTVDNAVRSSACVTAANKAELDISNIMTVRTKPYHAYWVDVDAPLLTRIKAYNLAITILRERIKVKRGYQLWNDPHPSPVVIWGNDDHFFERLSNFTEIRTVALSWIRSDCGSRNLLIQKYPEWIASEPLCTWIRTPGKTKARWDAVYNRTCVTDLDAALLERSLRPLYLHAKPINPKHYWPNKGRSYPRYFYTDPPAHVLYIHVAENAIITSVGDIFSGSVKIVPYSCSHDVTPSKPEGYRQAAIFSEVFIMSGHWGSALFHKCVELIPRIAPYLDFLRKHQDIMIQVSETGGMTASILNLLGIRKERLVSGSLRAKIAYLPQATPCGFGQVQELQILSKLYRDHIRSMKKQVNRVWNVIVIHRSGVRRLTDALHIELSIQKLAVEYGLQFKLFHDLQLPTFEETMSMFNDAALVVAPHGAGSSNILFCEPGTFFVEFVCNPPHVNMCYQHLAHVLGLRYHGIPSEEGCEDHIKINPKLVEFIVRMKLEQWKQLHSAH